ncbi:TetR family transcriptional regulator [Amycolatopsis nigrescens]|uniref:acyl-CoA-like ligand-binding transcription factor n=1 Tax=Amycolatopsis nigrescens TaxID=381445 RepID=UPI0005907480|nr:TetR family transcriptional regulator [Amycolatopsis nigrescens]
MPDQNQPASGLRARKKARTRNEIQRHALRLFRERGYAATTVEQIAEAAEVAPSTVFRYFPTKEDLADLTGYHSLLDEFTKAFGEQPAGLSVVEAFRRAFLAVFEDMPPDEFAARREREVLTLTVPELWAANLGNLTGAMRLVTELAAKRTGRDPGDVAVRNVARTVCGVALAVWFDSGTRPELDVVAELDQALAQLEAGLSL